MRYKYWVITFVMLTFLCSAGLGVSNYLLDPFGLRSVEDKDFYNISRTDISYLYPVKIAQKAPYYLVGTSRTGRINLSIAARYLQAHIMRVGSGGQTLQESLFLIKHIKANGGCFISGFDTFSLNTHYSSSDRLQNAFTVTTNENLLMLYMHPRTTQASLRYLRNKFFSQPHNKVFNVYDSEVGKNNSYQEIESNYFINGKQNFHFYILYRSYAVDIQKILELARLADSKDIVIIFPKYAYYYKLFAKYGVQEPYFQAIKLLVENTNARVFSFYGINSITLNKDNFDDNAWHFKPKIGNLILARIFKDDSIEVPKDFGVELTKDNIDTYLNTLRIQIRDYNPSE